MFGYLNLGFCLLYDIKGLDSIVMVMKLMVFHESVPYTGSHFIASCHNIRRRFLGAV